MTISQLKPSQRQSAPNASDQISYLLSSGQLPPSAPRQQLQRVLEAGCGLVVVPPDTQGSVEHAFVICRPPGEDISVGIGYGPVRSIGTGLNLHTTIPELLRGLARWAWQTNGDAVGIRADGVIFYAAVNNFVDRILTATMYELHPVELNLGSP